MTVEHIMKLANTYAASNGKALLEKLYGTSQSYTQQCAEEALQDRQSLLAAVEELAKENEELRKAYWKMRNSAAGYSTYCEDSASVRRCERDYEEAESMFRAIAAMKGQS